MDYIKGCLASEAFGDSCRKEALRNRAKGAGVAARTAQHSSLPSGQHWVAEANALLGYRTYVLGSWRGIVSGIRRMALFTRRKFFMARAVMQAVHESLCALYDLADFGHCSCCYILCRWSLHKQQLVPLECSNSTPDHCTPLRKT
jgi:hypothetical protein